MTGISLMYLIGTVFSYQFIRLVEKKIFDRNLSFLDRMFFINCLLIGVSGYYYYYWLITPSYNWLSLFSILAIVSSYIAYDLHESNTKNPLSLKMFIYSVLIAFFANMLLFSIATAIIPTSLLMLILLISSKKQTRIKLFFAVSVLVNFILFLFLHILFLFKDISYVSTAIKNSMETEKILDAGHSFSSLALINLNDFKSLLFSNNSLIAATIAVIIVCIFCFCRSRYIELLYKLFPLFISLLCIFWFDKHSYFGYDLYLVLFIMLLFMFMYNRYSKQSNSSLVFIIAFCSLALSTRFGSNAGVFRTSVTSIVFCFSALLIISFNIYKKNEFLRNCISLIMLIIIFKYCIYSYSHPYRLSTSLGNQKCKVSIYNNTSIIKVNSEAKKWIDDLNYYSQKNGWNSGNSLIDVTGATPGASVILKSRPVGQPWFAGSYPGSDEYAYTVLKKIPRKILEESWILTAPDGKIKISESIFKRLNINFPDNYEKVCELNNSYRDEMQILWKPKSF